MSSGETAAEWALRQVEAVRDQPAARLELIARTYRGPTGRAPRHLPFRRSAMSFIRWQINRGVLAPLTADPPGSPWWRAVNERLLRDGCEAVARSGGLSGTPSSHAVEQWMAFVSDPTAGTWYQAHNASITSAYLDHRDLADAESRPERFFLNVVLLRVLYAHALVEAPRLALGRLASLGPLLGDPRLWIPGVFVSLSRVLPDRYPLGDEVAAYVAAERNIGQILDYGLVRPRLQQLYGWSAQQLAEPALLECIREGSPTYAWSFADRAVWHPARLAPAVRAIERVAPPTNHWEQR
ncbi:hypothetical protein [Kribbella sp. VKM Ac-2568]|uniref:hypothetical protein n=1 Tax=Kribbella sp. VKM Ac-2568 TaxID=2512219 RepID=UPI001049BC2A|nr:hypothetical protein [Kribbella sp. VKM Ac-2568]